MNKEEDKGFTGIATGPIKVKEHKIELTDEKLIIDVSFIEYLLGIPKSIEEVGNEIIMAYFKLKIGERKTQTINSLDISIKIEDIKNENKNIDDRAAI